jgi:hypothetical protein
MKMVQRKGTTMKKWGLLAMSAALLLTIAWGGPAKSAYAAESNLSAQGQAAIHTISVTGKGEMTITPDVAYVTLGIETKAATAKEAQQANAAKFAKLKQALTKFNIASADVKTVNFYVNPEYNYNDKSGPKVTGYSATHMVQVTYRDLDNLGNLIDAASEAGVNQVSGIRFDTENPEAYETKVLEKAMSNAENKAKAIAAAAKQQIVTVINVVESNADVIPVYANQLFATASEAKNSAATTIETGQISIKANVTVMYEIK